MTFQMLTLLLPIITIPYISKTLGSEGVRLNSYSLSIVTIFFLIGSFGAAVYGQRQVAYSRNNLKELSNVFWGITLSRIISYLIAILILVDICLSTKFLYYEYVLLQGITLIAGLFDISWFFMGLEDFKRTVLRNTFVKIVSVLLIFIL